MQRRGVGESRYNVLSGYDGVWEDVRMLGVSLDDAKAYIRQQVEAARAAGADPEAVFDRYAIADTMTGRLVSYIL